MGIVGIVKMIRILRELIRVLCWIGMVLFFFAILLVTDSKAQVVDKNFGEAALYKNSVRQECSLRYSVGSPHGVQDCTCLEPWFDSIDLIKACQLVYNYMLARFDITYGQFYFGFWVYDGRQILRFGNKDLSFYIVGQLEVFENFESGAYPDLKASCDAAVLSGQTWMANAAMNVYLLWQAESYHRSLMGLPALAPPDTPEISEFINLN